LDPERKVDETEHRERESDGGQGLFAGGADVKAERSTRARSGRNHQAVKLLRQTDAVVNCFWGLRKAKDDPIHVKSADDSPTPPQGTATSAASYAAMAGLATA
jgi:hypothetical protein